MGKDLISRRAEKIISDKGQYALTLGVVAALLYVVGFPVFGIMFLGAIAYLVTRVFSHTSRNDTRKIFEFYLSANEILRDNERRWFGFEIQESIALGESTLRTLRSAPPLVHFTLGALYGKSGDHSSAVQHFQYVLEDNSVVEQGIVYPTPELREYVRVLRKIEREPAESPLTSSAVRSLERMRKNRGKAMLEESKKLVAELQIENETARELAAENGSLSSDIRDEFQDVAATPERVTAVERSASEENQTLLGGRKPITEVLHDIYDKKVH